MTSFLHKPYAFLVEVLQNLRALGALVNKVYHRRNTGERERQENGSALRYLGEEEKQDLMGSQRLCEGR